MGLTSCMSLISVINKWCRENNCRYADFQQMESLGYLEIRHVSSTDMHVRIKDQDMVDWFLKRI